MSRVQTLEYWTKAGYERIDPFTEIERFGGKEYLFYLTSVINGGISLTPSLFTLLHTLHEPNIVYETFKIHYNKKFLDIRPFVISKTQK